VTRPDFLRRIAELTIDSSVDELRVLLSVADRLNTGRRQYGPLRIGEDRRRWLEEMRDELLDAVAYSAMATVALTSGTISAPEHDAPSRAEMPTLTEEG